MSEEYLQRIRNKDRKAIEEIYALSFPQIKQYVCKNSGTKKDAEDIFQDAILVLFEKSKNPNFILSVLPSTYLQSIARNLWLKNLRKNKAVMVTTEASEVLMDERELGEQELATLRKALYRRKFKKLGQDCQKVLSLLFKGMTMNEIAQNMGYASAGYARKKKLTCKKKLLKLIQQDPLFKELSDHE